MGKRKKKTSIINGLHSQRGERVGAEGGSEGGRQ